MSVFSFLGSIVGVVGKVAGVVVNIFTEARPILEALRPAIEEVDIGMDWLEANAAVVGEEADDFLDRNLATINTLESVSARGVVFFGKLNELTVALRVASQESTPDTITDEEAANFIRLIGEMRDVKSAWGPDIDKALAQMDEAK
jgi:hypothetical protein